MTYYINKFTQLPTLSVFTAEQLSTFDWMVNVNTTDEAQLLSVGFIKVAEPLNEKTEGSVLVVQQGSDGVPYSEWLSNYAEVLKVQQDKNIVKIARNNKLKESDWTQAKDIPESVSSKWTEYRQALRDITAQEGFPYNITWPQQP